MTTEMKFAIVNYDTMEPTKRRFDKPKDALAELEKLREEKPEINWHVMNMGKRPGRKAERAEAEEKPAEAPQEPMVEDIIEEPDICKSCKKESTCPSSKAGFASITCDEHEAKDEPEPKKAPRAEKPKKQKRLDD